MIALTANWCYALDGVVQGLRGTATVLMLKVNMVQLWLLTNCGTDQTPAR